MMSDKWIKRIEEDPDFSVSVYCFSSVYGRYVSKLVEIGDTGYGTWLDAITGKEGGLPPEYWMEITYPEPPSE